MCTLLILLLLMANKLPSLTLSPHLSLSLLSLSFEEASGVFAVLCSLVPYLSVSSKVNVMEAVRRTIQQRPGCITTKVWGEYIHLLYMYHLPLYLLWMITAERRCIVIHCTCVTWSGTFQFSCTKNLKIFEFKNFPFSMWSLGKIMYPFFKQLKI